MTERTADRLRILIVRRRIGGETRRSAEQRSPSTDKQPTPGLVTGRWAAPDQCQLSANVAHFSESEARALDGNR